jgi:hypothetical protein
VVSKVSSITSIFKNQQKNRLSFICAQDRARNRFLLGGAQDRRFVQNLEDNYKTEGELRRFEYSRHVEMHRVNVVEFTMKTLRTQKENQSKKKKGNNSGPRNGGSGIGLVRWRSVMDFSKLHNLKRMFWLD